MQSQRVELPCRIGNRREEKKYAKKDQYERKSQQKVSGDVKWWVIDPPASRSTGWRIPGGLQAAKDQEGIPPSHLG